MSKDYFFKLLCLVFLFSLVNLVIPVQVSANHSWGNYHWARTANPFNLKLANNLSSIWVPYLNTTATDWSLSSVLDMTVVNGAANPRTCKPTLGRVEVCNSRYGNNGWLGIAQIWTNGTHIVQGVTKMNDTYFSTPTYNTTTWRNLVLCQEVGHTFGLDHQDEIFNNPNLGSCMDYTNNPSTNQHPNQHDYDQLELIYGHLDSFNSSSQASVSGNQAHVNMDNPSEWGQLVRSGDKTAVFERHLGIGRRVFTFVVYAE